jgi:hypothetical protein
LVAKTLRDANVNDILSCEWAVVLPGDKPSEVEWSTWIGKVNTRVDPGRLGIDWDPERSTGETVDPTENPQRFPGVCDGDSADGAIVWYRSAILTRTDTSVPRRPRLIQKRIRDEELNTTGDHDDFADQFMDAQKGGVRTASLCDGLRVPAEVSDSDIIWCPERWTGNGTAWANNYEQWKSRLGLSCSDAEEAQRCMKRVLIAKALLDTARAPTTKSGWEPVFMGIAEVGEQYALAYLNSAAASKVRERFAAQWRDGRVNMPAVMEQALATKAPPPAVQSPAPTGHQTQPTTDNRSKEGNFSTRLHGKGRGGGRRGGN